MEISPLYKERSRSGQNGNIKAVDSYCDILNDFITEDRSYFVKSMGGVFFENQGSTMVQVDNTLLLPGDQIIVEAAGYFLKRFRILFLSTYPFSKAISTYPEISSGNKLHIVQFTVKGTLAAPKVTLSGGANVKYRVVRSSIPVIDKGSTSTTVIVPPTSATLTNDRFEVTAGIHNVAAGAFLVEVLNTGLDDIDVNGDAVPPAGKWTAEERLDRVNNVQYFTPAITITVPAGGTASYLVQSP